MPPGTKEPATVESFLKCIEQSGLLNETDLEAFLKTIPKEQQTDARSLADQFIKRGKLSTFQAQKLLKGAYVGLLLGAYEIVAPIGKGGMGMVYLARDTRINKLLALKILPPKKARTEKRMVERFEREVKINQKVAHPHIAWTYEGSMIQGVYYIAMEYIPGMTLSRLVAQRGPLTVPAACRLGVEVALGLYHAHSQSVIHRDLKPSNIMVTPNGHAKILDLGLALVEGEVNTREVIGGPGYVVGSMDYISPEQIKDAVSVDGRADIYSLGCTLFFALTGRPPYPGGTAVEKMKRHRKEPAPSVRSINPQVPPGLAEILLKMMSKSPADRYPSMREVREALFPWATHEPDLPMDQSGDRSFLEAIRALQTEDIPSEMVNEAIVARPAEGSNSVTLETPPQTDAPAEFLSLLRSGTSGYLWLGLGIIGFWVVLLLVLGLILLLRE
jgi:serine/threonine protein kinase